MGREGFRGVELGPTEKSLCLVVRAELDPATLKSATLTIPNHSAMLPLLEVGGLKTGRSQSYKKIKLVICKLCRRTFPH